MFQIGDVVVCVDDTPTKPILPDLRKKKMYKISLVDLAIDDEGYIGEGVLVEGVESDSESYCATRFRKIKPASKEFMNSIRVKQDA